ncbi:hypothetical protein AMELA_G00235910 [Ameiurus melas]|uniref:Uncharacterized protein n=1 Tax=Ameiurus melas TaxID=219545 RepID=A0A7J5ZY82_AMEME|nr:hypothetical protein AMELA_G00235910 [Ameiurus melas]
MSGMLTKVVADLEDLAVIRRSVTAIEIKFSDIVTRVADAEKRIEYLESSERALSANPPVTKRDLEKIFERLEDLENRSRRNNLRIIGVPEYEEGRDMVKFLHELFPSLLDITGHKLEIERAYRVPAWRSGEGDRLRPILARFLRSFDKDLVLCQARSKGRLSWKNHNIFFFPNFANSTREKHDRFKECKKVLHQQRLKDTVPVLFRIHFHQSDHQSKSSNSILNIDCKTTTQVEVPFQINCRNTSCVSDLQLDFKFLNTLLVVDQASFIVHVTLLNKGDDLFNTSVVLSTLLIITLNVQDH